MKLSLFQTSLRTSLIMLAFAVVGTALLAYTFSQTHVLIQKSEEVEKLELIKQVLPAGSYDNDLIHDTFEIKPAPLLGNSEPVLAYRARLNGAPAAIVLEATAPDGYSGKIKLLISILASGEISGVRVLAHNETPGLGDYIDIAKNPWIRIFDRRSLDNTQAAGWQVKKDGGNFDYMTGATITPRAVVKAVHKALLYYAENRAALFKDKP